MANLRSERGVIVDWLLKLLIGLALFAVVGYDAGSILVNTFTLDSGADDVAIAVSTGITPGNRLQFTDEEVYDLAKEAAANPDTGVKNARVVREGTGIDPATGQITIKLRRTASTLIVGRIGAIKHWATADAEGIATTQ